MAWTKEQEKALSTRGKNLLLSASAGSGKTAVLTERITRLVSHPENHIQITDLLVLTFTNAAAGEMRSRITSSLTRELQKADEEGNRELAAYLEKQISLSASSQISTLDSFFQSLIRQYFYLIGLDPQTRLVSDENEMFLFKQDVLASVLETYYEKGDPAFLETADLFSSRYQDSTLRSTILSLYQYARSLPFPLEWLARLPKAYHLSDSDTLDSLGWSRVVLDSVRAGAAEIESFYRQMFAIMKTEPDLQSVYGDVYGSEYAYFSQMASVKSWKELYSLGPISFATIRTNTKEVKNKISDPVRFKEIKEPLTGKNGLHDRVKKRYAAKIEPLLSMPPGEWLREIRAMEPIVKVLSDLGISFYKALAEAKKEEGIMDFGDLEHFALDILLDKKNPDFSPEKALDFPSEAALSLRKKYKEILIDEYQDTNSVQELITALISNGSNRFMVGDVKQSIYRFRLADPSIFLDKYASFSKDGNTPDYRIDLNRNFRSDSMILSGINFLFRQFMTPEELELTYEDEEALYAGRVENERPANYVGGPISIKLIDKKDVKDAELDETKIETDNIKIEGRLIAATIRDLVDSHRQVENKDGTFRDIRYGDIVILLRSVAQKGPALLKTLEENGIPAAADQEDDFMKSTEVMILWALLKLLDNPRQDLAMTAVLRSYFVGLNEADLARLSLAQKESGAENLFDVLPQASSLLPPASAERVSHFLEEFAEWRRQSFIDGIAPLIRKIEDDTDYIAYVSGLPGGAFRKNHLEAFYQLALGRDETTQNGLYRFLNYLTRLTGEQRDFKSTAPGTAMADTVRIMTIHKSKGLEFPVVFLADAGKRFNRKSYMDIALFHKKLGLGIEYYDPKYRCRWPSLYWTAVRSVKEKEGRAEEARLLYVAMTRARDKLYITGTLGDLGEKLDQWAAPLAAGASGDDDIHLPSYAVSSASSYLDWIMPAALRNRTMKNAWDTATQVPSYLDDAPYDHSAFSFEAVKQQSLFTREEEKVWEEKGRALPQKFIEKKEKQAEEEKIRRFIDSGSDLPVPEWMERQLAWSYPYPGAVSTPAKLTATQATRMIEERENREADVAPLPSAVLVPEMEEEVGQESHLPEGFEEPSFLSPKEIAASGTDYGTLMHRAMELIDWTTVEPSAEAVRKEIRSLGEKGLFNEEEERRLLSRGVHGPVPSFLTFLKGPLAKLMKEAEAIHKEMPFSILLPADHFYPDCEKGETLFMQGVMDCLLEMKEGIIIIDYKTDRRLTAEELTHRYGRQLSIYGEAAASLFRKPVIGLYLWSFALGKAIPVKGK